MQHKRPTESRGHTVTQERPIRQCSRRAGHLNQEGQELLPSPTRRHPSQASVTEVSHGLIPQERAQRVAHRQDQRKRRLRQSFIREPQQLQHHVKCNPVSRVRQGQHVLLRGEGRRGGRLKGLRQPQGRDPAQPRRGTCTHRRDRPELRQERALTVRPPGARRAAQGERPRQLRGRGGGVIIRLQEQLNRRPVRHAVTQVSTAFGEQRLQVTQGRRQVWSTQLRAEHHAVRGLARAGRRAERGGRPRQAASEDTHGAKD